LESSSTAEEGSAPGDEMTERENKKSFKDRAKDVIQGLIEAVESAFPSPERELVPVRVVARPRPMRSRRR
jgi:hypothetical protein